MAALSPVRGTKDLIFDDARRMRRVADTGRAVAALYGYDEIATPVFEFTNVFARTLGDTSDIVTKEMYTFEDKGGDSLTLRPEGTAGIARAFISNGLTQDLPLRVFYQGPMFRYERPQKGRMRQFHQIGVEVLGIAQPQADIEVIALGAQILAELGLGDRVQLEINTLGDTASRAAYRDTLVAYLSGHKDGLSEDSLARLDRNPMRILDSKDEGDKAVVAGAPVMSDSMNDESRAFFDTVLEGLTALDIPFVLNPKLVRGLDYYGHTAFEFTTTDLGAQGTVMAGGRYDGLIKQMGGPPTPGVGWAAGIERLSMMAGEGTPLPRPVAVIPVGADNQALGLRLAHDLRRAGIAADLAHSGNLGKRMKRANKVGARAAVIIGDDERARGVATLRDMDSGEQSDVPLDGLVETLKAAP
ncbi:MAG: histidine--tRNA ligase [Rhodobacterales bacterium]|nr:histidine--tRNA ligase [Rhodobacterales bacterium]